MIFAEQVALVHSYLRAKIHLRGSPFQKDIPILVKNQFLLNSPFTPALWGDCHIDQKTC